MAYLKVFSVVYMLITVGKGVESPAGNSEPRLKLSDQGSANRDSYKELHGCYHHNVDLKLCFDIGSDFMKLSDTNGRTLVSLRGLRDGLSLFQILDGHFIHHRSQSFLVALPNDFEAKEFLVGLPRQHAYNYTFLAGSQQLLEAKLTKLRDTPEMKLLELLSAALGRQKRQIKTLLGFHAMSRALLNNMNIQLAPEFRAADLNRMGNGRRKRCADIQSNPEENECLGMCGPGCDCWSWVCGDCCEHIGCKQHDTCCRVGGIFSTRCLLPFFYEFSCSSYGGYPDCLN